MSDYTNVLLVFKVTMTPTPSPPPSPTLGPRCRVVSRALNLRSGPGVTYDPPLLTLPKRTMLIPLARDLVGQWIQIEVVGSRQLGWVSAGRAYVRCNVDIPDLRVGFIPPTPTPAPTPTPPRPTSTPPVAILEDCVPYNPNTLQIVNEGARGWLLTDGTTRLQLYDTKPAAENALARARQHTALCSIAKEEFR